MTQDIELTEEEIEELADLIKRYGRKALHKLVDELQKELDDVSKD